MPQSLGASLRETGSRASTEPLRVSALSGFDPARDAAPPAYQAEALRGQVCDDVSRRFWRARQRLLRAFEDRKEQVQRDYEKLPAEQFLAKYNGWRFL